MSLMDQINLERVTAERDVALAAWIDAQVRIVALTDERDLLRVFRAEVIAERDAALAAVERVRALLDAAPLLNTAGAAIAYVGGMKAVRALDLIRALGGEQP